MILSINYTTQNKINHKNYPNKNNNKQIVIKNKKIYPLLLPMNHAP